MDLRSDGRPCEFVWCSVIGPGCSPWCGACKVRSVLLSYVRDSYDHVNDRRSLVKDAKLKIVKKK